MKRLIGVIFALFIVCMPMSVYANEGLCFEYTGYPVEIEDAYGYYSIDEGMSFLDPPMDIGRYYAFTNNGYIEFSIVPKKVHVKVLYNKDWKLGDLEESKYLCDYEGDYTFKLGIKESNDFFSKDSYKGNYKFVFDPPNTRDVPIVKTKITHENVELVYTGDGIKIYSDNELIKPIILKDAGTYDIAFDVDSMYYESIPFKVTIFPKEVKVPINSIIKMVGDKDPNFEENEDYKVIRESGEEIGNYKLNIISKSKNYKYIPYRDAFLIIQEKVEEAPEPEISCKGSNDTFQENENIELKESEIKQEKVVLSTETKSSKSEQVVIPLKNTKVNTGVKDTTVTYILIGLFSCIGFVFIKKHRI